MNVSGYIKRISIFVAILVVSFTIGCTKENFVEPPDPFETQTLEPEPQTIILGEGDEALVLKTNHANVIETAEGIRIKGSLFVDNPKYGDIRITNGDFEILKNEAGNYYDMTGYAISELPREGFMNTLQMVGMPAAPMGMKKGSEFELGAFNWPVHPNRYYFYYENTNPLAANISGSSLENITKIAIDPTDPYFFMQGDISGTVIGDLSDVGIAMSAQGLIPYTPHVTINNIPGFYGHLYLSGTVPLLNYPLAVAGEAVLAFGSSDGDGSDEFFSGEDSDFALGINGKVIIDHTALDWLNVEVELAGASIYLAMQNSGSTKLMFAGEREFPPMTPSDFVNEVVGQDWDFLDYLVISESKETFYGTIGTELSDWELGFKHESYLNIFGKHYDMGHAWLELSSDHMYFSGEAAVGGLNRVGVKGYANRDGDFRLEGYGKSSLHASWGGLSFGYSLGMDVFVELEDGTFAFGGSFKIKGRACVDMGLFDVCASITVRGTVYISSDGSFEICFGIGVGRLGFDVCIGFDRVNASGPDMFVQRMTYKEVPLEEIPLENRFPAECFEKENPDDPCDCNQFIN